MTNDAPRSTRPRRGLRMGQPARNSDLGAMQDDGVWHVDPWCSESDRNRRIPDHQFGTMIPGESAHPSGQPRVRKQPRFTRAGDGEPLLSVERHRSLVGRCVDRHVVGGKATPQLPEVGRGYPLPLGGKSLVTSRWDLTEWRSCCMAARPGSGSRGPTRRVPAASGPGTLRSRGAWHRFPGPRPLRCRGR